MAPLRPSDAPGAKVMPPTEEIFPEDGELTVDYAAGGAHATVEGNGELRLAIDGIERPAVPVAQPKLLTLAEHPRHESHTLSLRPDQGVRILSVSFAAALP